MGSIVEQVRGISGRRVSRERGNGPIGTASRVAGGLIAIAVPIAISGFGWWDAFAALVLLPLIALAAAALVAASFNRYAPATLDRHDSLHVAQAFLLCGLVVGAGIGLTFVTPLNGAVAIWAFLGVSMLVAAVRGYAGCEVLAIPNAITGREDQVGCLIYTPIDLAEAKR